MSDARWRTAEEDPTPVYLLLKPRKAYYNLQRADTPPQVLPSESQIGRRFETRLRLVFHLRTREFERWRCNTSFVPGEDEHVHQDGSMLVSVVYKRSVVGTTELYEQPKELAHYATETVDIQYVLPRRDDD